MQPLIGKFILPWFGGSPAVWTTCLLFFQLLLLGGYAYAHLSSRCFVPRVQAAIHLGLLGLAVAFLPITPAGEWKPVSVENPTWHILKLLLACLGLPYFVLSATGPLMQDWFRQLNPGVSPYRLYALSNLGSLLALVSYPFAFEPAFARTTQAGIWSWCLGFFAVLCGWCAFRLWRANPTSAGVPEKVEALEGVARANDECRMTILWFVLPASASVLLLAFTNKICQDVAVIPFLWVLPLGLYLLSFIICFDSPGLYSRKSFSVAFLLLLILLCDALFEGVNFPLALQVGIYAATLFVCCMICHGELC
ncbi:MAG TPA: ferrichrome ABC transporter permease, partial [Candidatus Eisenbacteria bacterium]|nr:ferrichrome ABC transporter permease [Candidatus Eisenbacteria bacterium]